MGSFFSYLVLLPIILLIVFFKRKSQLGKTWRGPISAKVELSDILLICRHCNSDVFFKREALIHTSFIQLFFWSSLNQSGSAYECTRCGCIHWFSRPKETSVEFVNLFVDIKQTEALPK